MPRVMTSDYLRNRVRDRASHLAYHLARWDTRGEEASPEVRQAATDAVGEIDAMLRALYSIRAELVAEIRRNDDAVAARVDAFLAERGAT